MLITKTSALSGKVRTLDIPVKQEDLDAWMQGDVSIQEAMPYLTEDEREFILSGITAEEWDSVFKEIEE